MTEETPRQKLEPIWNDAERNRLFGSIELEIRGGRITVVRVTKADRFDAGEKTHEQRLYR
jgi:hypothetical protein